MSAIIYSQRTWIRLWPPHATAQTGAAHCPRPRAPTCRAAVPPPPRARRAPRPSTARTTTAAAPRTGMRARVHRAHARVREVGPLQACLGAPRAASRGGRRPRAAARALDPAAATPARVPTHGHRRVRRPAGSLRHPQSGGGAQHLAKPEGWSARVSRTTTAGRSAGFAARIVPHRRDAPGSPSPRR